MGFYSSPTSTRNFRIYNETATWKTVRLSRIFIRDRYASHHVSTRKTNSPQIVDIPWWDLRSSLIINSVINILKNIKFSCAPLSPLNKFSGMLISTISVYLPFLNEFGQMKQAYILRDYVVQNKPNISHEIDKIPGSSKFKGGCLTNSRYN